ncbi:hypothetical protein P4B35_10570 [Pontiellaceae bacterium B12227]|nr:hypothetical protein [Pontiellaceae bacterium B12227]
MEKNMPFPEQELNTQNDEAEIVTINTEPPFIWPDIRAVIGMRGYEDNPPFKSFLCNASLIGGVVVGASDETIQLLEELLAENKDCRVKLVFIVYPACPTRQHHLDALKELEALHTDPDQESRVEFRVLPVSRQYGDGCEKMALVPTVLETVNQENGKTMLCIGSCANLGMDGVDLSSFNTVFNATEAHRNLFRKWFQVVFLESHMLNDQSINIPNLVPAEGDLEAAGAWREYVGMCASDEELVIQTVEIDPKTGEVVSDVDGLPVEEWDGGETKLDALAQKFQEVYANGYLVSVDETSRIGPLTIPVSPTLFGQESERTIGAVKKKLSFTLEILDSGTAKEINKYRKTDVIRLCSYSLSKGVHWIPEKAQPLLNRELDEQNSRAVEALKNQVGDGSVDGFIGKNAKRYMQDLNSMYRDMGGEGDLPAGAFEKVLEMIRARLEKALNGRITPTVNYNQVSAPNLAESAPAEQWSQPLTLLLATAKMMRKSLADPRFSWNFSKRSFKQTEYVEAMDVFGDSILVTKIWGQADQEIKGLAEIELGDGDSKEKCQKVWEIMSGIRGVDSVSR